MNANTLQLTTQSRLPELIAAAGERASMRFLEFFAANIRNPHTRRAYALDIGLDLAILHIGDERALLGREHVASSSPLFCQQQGAETVQGPRPSVDFLRGRLALLMDAAKS